MNLLGARWERFPPPVWRIAALVVLGLVALVGCRDSGMGVEELTVADLAGSWDVVSFRITSHEDPQVSFDLIEAGAAMFVAIQPNGDFQGASVVPGHMVGIPEIGVVTVPLVGFVQMTGPGRMRIDYIPDIPPVFTTWQPDFVLVGDTIDGIDPAVTFDFDDDGSWDPAIFQARLIRR